MESQNAHAKTEILIEHPSKDTTAKINQRLRWSGCKEDILPMNFKTTPCRLKYLGNHGHVWQ